MTLESTISKINQQLISSFASLDEWFDYPTIILYEKQTEAWSAAEILEHVMLSNHYLLKIIDKTSEKAMKRARRHDLKEVLCQYHFNLSSLDAIANPQAFSWYRPEHMIPSGERELTEVRRSLRDQLYRCLCHLDALKQGEGVLAKTQMSVINLGKLDVYQYLYFLALHAQRHCRQLEITVKGPGVDWLI